MPTGMPTIPSGDIPQGFPGMPPPQQGNILDTVKEIWDLGNDVYSTVSGWFSGGKNDPRRSPPSGFTYTDEFGNTYNSFGETGNNAAGTQDWPNVKHSVDINQIVMIVALLFILKRK